MFTEDYSALDVIVGAANAFYSSTANGVTTTEFLSWFPKTIEFKEASSAFCSDLSWWILGVGFTAMAGFGLLPRIRPVILFYSLVAWGFFTFAWSDSPRVKITQASQ